MRYLFFLLISALFWHLTNSNVTTDNTKLNQDSTTLKQAAPFPLGVSVDARLLTSNKQYRNTVNREFNSITSENALKMNRLLVAPNQYDWSGGDSIVDFARTTGKRMHGHTLVWHRSVPKWVEAFQGDSIAWENLLKSHIQTVIGHYKGQVKSWDVANEVIDDNGSLRKSIWSAHLGPDYVARCYQYAHEADPKALLFYNDYGQEINLKKALAIKAMLLNLRKRKIPIHGVGLQSHISIYHSDSQYRRGLAVMTSVGLLVHISELDIRLNTKKIKTLTITENMLEEQEQKYESIVEIYKDVVPKKQRYGITIWNLSDKDSYQLKDCQCPDAPMPFDTTYKKKLAYKGLLDGLRQ
ncbi:endo-1,4-beta-xylanase [Spirosoma sp. RP8]|uniref:Beta-xylanase n=1 Tax=Spirosoma liriopis TaxID=2937440 RepID=A0ABT0HMI3_9BACT|nr:endo-1,4-beta-xylanase [Spirosoma liriopis]MCK8492770.1 endo-1,4-beta-xylanase [Spirosoma liriopis]